MGCRIILLIGWLIAKAVSKAVSKALGLVLSKIGFGKLIEKTGLTGTLKQANVDADGIVVKLVYYFILLIALQLAFGVFGETNPVSALLNDIIAFLPRILVALVLVIVALGQVNIATTVTGPVLVTVLATIGGGLIKPAQDRWQGWLANLQGRLVAGEGKQEARSEPPTSPVGISRVDS